jgi:hypothetical protein
MRSETESLKTGRDYAKAEQRSRVLEIVVREVKKFGTLFLYLALVFGLFTLHQWVVLASNHISYAFYGASIINALILAKIMLVAEALHFGERFRDKPLAYPILYKSVAFGLMLVVAYVAEEVLVGLLKGKEPGAQRTGIRRRNGRRNPGHCGDHVRGTHSILRLQGNTPRLR